MSEAEAAVHVTREGATWRLRLNRPQVGNALSAVMVQGLSMALDSAASADARLVVFEGAGRHFCTGFDLSALDDETDDSLLARFVRIELLLQRISAAPFMTMALASGRVMGAGADLFAACEARCIAGEASFSFPGAGFGLVLGTARLAQRVGATTALQWVGSGRRIDTAEALGAGLASQHCALPAGEELVATTAKALQRLDGATHAAVRRAVDQRSDSGRAHDLAALVASAARPGLKERIHAYRQASLQTPGR